MNELFLTIVNMSISASWIVLAVLVLRLLLKKSPKWITVLLWGIVAIRLVCPFSLESVLSLIPSAETISPEIITESSPAIDSGVPIIDNTVNPIIGESFTPTPGDSVNPLQVWILVASIVWVIGIAAMLLYTVISYLRVKAKIGTAVLLRDNIFQSENVVSPFVLGLIRPKIYLPFNMNEQDMTHVIAHEKAHISRRDHLWKPFGFLVLAVHWFNPLMWLSYTLLCKDIELACDEKVIKEFDSEQKADYSQALLSCSVNRRMIAACPLAFGEVSVKDRIKSVLSYKKPAFWIIIAAVVVSLIASVCFLTNPKTRLNDELSVFIDMQIAEHHYKKDVTDDNFVVTNFEVLDIKGPSNKPTVYMWAMYQEYSYENGEIKPGEGSHIPTVITAKCTGSHGHYELVEYWIPRDGTYYAKDIEEKFPWHLHGKALDSQRYVKRQREFCDNAAKEYFEAANLNNWTYSPMLSHTAHYSKAFYFNLDYTHIDATCTFGKMWNRDTEGQPLGTQMRFENGKTVCWTPDEAIIERLPQKSEVTLTIYKNETQLHKCTVVFECVARDVSSAKFLITLKEADGLSMSFSDSSLRFTAQDTVTQPENSVSSSSDQTLLNVLYSKWQFIDQSGKSLYFKDFKPAEEVNAIPEKYALIDLDHDGENELVVDFSYNLGGCMVFHLYNDRVYGYAFWQREFQILKTDGTICGSSGAALNSYYTLQFDKDKCLKTEEAYIDDVGKVYRINGVASTKAKADEYYNQFAYKPGVTWQRYRFTFKAKTNISSYNDLIISFTPDYKQQTVSELNVYSPETNQKLQTISLNAQSGFNTYSMGTIYLADLNFDGYDDIIVPFDLPASGAYYSAYMWDIYARRFVYAPSFELLPNVALDKEEKTVLSSRSGDKITSHSITVFDAVKKDFKTVKTLSYYYNEGKMHYKEEEFKNGFWQTVASHTKPPVNNDYYRMDPELYTYYSDHPDWDLDSNKWQNYLIPQKSATDSNADHMAIYQAFLKGGVSVNKNGAICTLEQYFTLESGDYRYTFLDMTKDGVPELCIHSLPDLIFFTIKDGVVHLWHSEGRLESKLLNNGAVLYERHGGAPPHINYEYYELDQNGNVKFSISFAWWDKADVNDTPYYEVASKQVTKEEFEAKTEKYLSIGSDKLVWYNKE